MPRHRRPRARLFVRRRDYADLWARYQSLREDYRALDTDLQNVLEAHEELLYARETDSPEPGGPDGPVAPVPARRAPSWAETEELPAAAPEGMDPEKALALVRRADMLGSPGGSWRVRSRENG